MLLNEVMTAITYGTYLYRKTTYHLDFENVALRKPTTQSSTGSDEHGSYGANRAVDGNKNRDFNKLSCTHTHYQDERPWWRVDLQQAYTVHKVTMFVSLYSS